MHAEFGQRGSLVPGGDHGAHTPGQKVVTVGNPPRARQILDREGDGLGKRRLGHGPIEAMAAEPMAFAKIMRHVGADPPRATPEPRPRHGLVPHQGLLSVRFSTS